MMSWFSILYNGWVCIYIRGGCILLFSRCSRQGSDDFPSISPVKVKVKDRRLRVGRVMDENVWRQSLQLQVCQTTCFSTSGVDSSKCWFHTFSVDLDFMHPFGAQTETISL